MSKPVGAKAMRAFCSPDWDKLKGSDYKATAVKLNGWTGSFPKLGVPFWGPHNKDYSILGSILGSPIVGNYQQESCVIRCT